MKRMIFAALMLCSTTVYAVTGTTTTGANGNWPRNDSGVETGTSCTSGHYSIYVDGTPDTSTVKIQIKKTSVPLVWADLPDTPSWTTAGQGTNVEWDGPISINVSSAGAATAINFYIWCREG